MFKMTKRFFAVRGICLILLCTIVFVWVGTLMSQKSENTIIDIGTIYMSEMSKQIHQKFDAIIDLKLSQAQGIVKRTPQTDEEYTDELAQELALSAEIREFTYLGLYTEDGQEQVLYGSHVDSVNKEEFMEVLHDKTKRMTTGFTANGQKILMLAIDANYPMKNGKRSSSLVVGLPMSYLEEPQWKNKRRLCRRIKGCHERKQKLWNIAYGKWSISTALLFFYSKFTMVFGGSYAL